jgi:hypothetical protein
MVGHSVDVVRVILQTVPQENLKEGAQRGDVCPHGAREDGASWHVTVDEVLQVQLEGCHRILILKDRSRR